MFESKTFAVVGLTRCPRDFLPKCSRGILFVCFLGVVPFVTRREIFHRCLFRAGPAFVLVCEDHFCHDFLPKCSRGILFVCFLGVLPFVTRREILFWHACRHVERCVLSEVIGIAWAVHHVGACVAHTEQVWSTGFHSGSNAYYITPHSQT